MKPKLIDLRSDTVTRPTPEMRAAIAAAPVGDDVLSDDPTVNQLEQRTAEILNFPAAVFMPSGTMTNQIALRTHTEPGDEVILEAESHIYYYEAGAPAALSGLMCRLIPGQRGLFTPADLQAALRPRNQHFPKTKLVCLENTHNRGGGSVWPLAQIAAVAQAARAADLKVHLDGARIWNAALAAHTTEAEIASHFDSVSVCFSKGLGAPVGSALLGSTEFITRARRFRKMFGGGMRQAGIIAAGALHALEHHRARIAQDHQNARTLAQGLAALPGITLDPQTVQTNIVAFQLDTIDSAQLIERLARAHVAVLPRGPQGIRAVTHLDITAENIQTALTAFQQALTDA